MTLLGSVLACLALTGITAAAAQAEGIFEATEYPATISGEQTETFEFEVEEVGTMECEVATVMGDMTGASSAIELVPDFEECTFSGLEATFVNEGCALMVYAGEENEESEEFESSADVVCETEAQKFKWHIPGTNCILSAGAGVKLKDLSIKPNIKDLDVTIRAKKVDITAAIENTPPKKCGLPTGQVKVTVKGGITVGKGKLKILK